MNKYFLEDLKKEAGLDYDLPSKLIMAPVALQLYIAQKLWSVEQLLKNQEQR